MIRQLYASYFYSKPFMYWYNSLEMCQSNYRILPFSQTRNSCRYWAFLGSCLVVSFSRLKKLEVWMSGIFSWGVCQFWIATMQTFPHLNLQADIYQNLPTCWIIGLHTSKRLIICGDFNLPGFTSELPMPTLKPCSTYMDFACRSAHPSIPHIYHSIKDNKAFHWCLLYIIIRRRYSENCRWLHGQNWKHHYSPTRWSRSSSFVESTSRQMWCSVALAADSRRKEAQTSTRTALEEVVRMTHLSKILCENTQIN